MDYTLMDDAEVHEDPSLNPTGLDPDAQSKKRRKRVIITVAVLVPLVAAAVVAVLFLTHSKGNNEPSDPTTIPSTVKSQIFEMMNSSANPCTNFYEYACGNWSAHFDLAGRDQYYVGFSTIAKTVDDELHKVLTQTFAPVRTFLAQCLDTNAIDARGWKEPLTPWIQHISALQTPSDLFSLLGAMNSKGLAEQALFSWSVMGDFLTARRYRITVGPGGLTFPEIEARRNLSRATGLLSPAVEVGFHAVQDVAGTIIGNDLHAAARDVARVEGFLASIAPEDPETTPGEAAAFSNVLVSTLVNETGLPFDSFFEALLDREPTLVQLYLNEYLTRLGQEIAKGDAGELSMQSLRRYMLWHLLYGVLDYLPAEFRAIADSLSALHWQRCPSCTDPPIPSFAPPEVRAAAQKQSSRVSSVQALTRNDLCRREIRRVFYDWYEHQWVVDEFPKANRPLAQRLVGYIYNEMGNRLRNATWLDDATRKRAVEKWDNIVANIGYDSTWEDFSSLQLTDKALDDLLAINDFQNGRQTATIDNVVVRDRFQPGLPIVAQNAFYDPSTNTINMLAGLMFPPYFSATYPMMLNLAAYGLVIGHEITHGFDNNGRHFGDTGAYTNWWTDESAERFNTRAQCLIDQYSDFRFFGLPVNGSHTLGENIADNGGAGVSYAAYRLFMGERADTDPLLEGFSNDQLFFLYFAQTWCAKFTAAAAPDILANEHSPPEFRVNGPLSNHPAFANAYNCKPDEYMGRSLTPARCEVW